MLVRVGADLSAGGGSWNGPVDSQTGEFTYVAIPENRPVHAGLEKPYAALVPALARFGVSLPAHLAGRHMHLDPDFDHLTYGEQGPPEPWGTDHYGGTLGDRPLWVAKD